MNEIRITFGSDDFPTISKVLIELGVSFRVEPVRGMASESATGSAPRLVASAPRKPAKKPPKGKPGKAESASPTRAVSLAERLRAATARNAAVEAAALEASNHSARDDE